MDDEYRHDEEGESGERRPVEIEREDRSERRSSWVIPLLAALALTIAGLAIWGPMTRRGPAPFSPAPTRISRRVVPPARNMPTKRIPGVSATSARDLNRSLSRAETAVRRNDWAMAQRETTRLGALWARLKPQASGLRPAVDAASFDATYAKLKTNVTMKNKDMTMRDLRRLRTLLGRTS